MKQKQPRLRLFAGPNGSGKSTLKNMVSPELLGAFINADELEYNANTAGLIDFSHYNLTLDHKALAQYCATHSILKSHDIEKDIIGLKCKNNCLMLDALTLNSYHASAICNYIRDELLKTKKSFSFETVMSHESKVSFLRDAQNLGYRTYLYFVATDSPDINVLRVKERVEHGGHPVPEDKIRSRYIRSLNLLYQAITYSNRAYIFDNTPVGGQPVWIAEINSDEIIAKTEGIPDWFIETWGRL